MTEPISRLAGLLDQSDNPEELLYQLHQLDASSILEGRHVVAGAARSFVLQLAKVEELVEKDPLFQESFLLANERTLVVKKNLQNIFLIMKYGLKHLEGDIIEFGCCAGGSAIFMANVARRLGMKSTVYALDTFEGMPAVDPRYDLHRAGEFQSDLSALEGYVEEIGLENITLVKGLFQETAPALLQNTKKIILAHIDCDIYSAVKYAIATVSPSMHESGGYLVLDDPLCPSCLGAFQAVEEMLIWEGFRAEQSCPQLVYRVPKLIAGR
ncbi:MAG: TylF/MycF family methyltransferase [Chthoniobacterales bacterium]|nr:TylF/MycF family methyltransferase [Chthoniobacterales bacterium]